MELQEQIKEINTFFKKYKIDVFVTNDCITGEICGRTCEISYREGYYDLIILAYSQVYERWVWPLSDRGIKFMDWKKAFIYAHLVSNFSGLSSRLPNLASIMSNLLMRDFDIEISEIPSRKITNWNRGTRWEFI